MSRRQSLTDENLTTNENLRALALELAADPKYKGYLSSHKFVDPWPYLFRKKFNLKDLKGQVRTISEKQQILKYSDSNPELSLREIGEHFSTLFGRTISENTIQYIRKTREKLMDQQEEENARDTFSQDLYEEVSRRQSLTDENFTNKNLRALAKELAADPKYKGYLSNNMFSNRWIANFRRKYDMEEGIMSSVLARNSFLQDLQAELSRRQGLTKEDVYSHMNLKPLALELARQPKYQKCMANFKCSKGWMTEFRKKFQILSIRHPH